MLGEGQVHKRVWHGMWSLRFFQRKERGSKTPMNPLFNAARLEDLQDRNVGLYSRVLSVTLLEFISGVCFQEALPL